MASSRSGKNVTRQAEAPFTSALELIQFTVLEGQEPRCGHVVGENATAGTIDVLLPLRRTPITIKSTTVTARFSTVPPPPGGMYVPEDASDPLDVDEAKYYDFSCGYGLPPCLFVAVAATAADSVLVTEALEGHPVIKAATVCVSDTYKDFQPWAEFAPGPGERVHCLELAYVDDVPRAAHRLAARGFQVAGPVMKTGITSARTIRIKPTVLRWIRDVDRLVDLALIVDTDMENVPVYSGKDRTVQRNMLNWGRFAAAAIKDPDTSNLDAAEFAEPLASYVTAVKTFQSSRACADLEFNAAPKLSRDQVAQSLALFYWAAVHRDDATQALPKPLANCGLDMYLAFGHVVLTKRPYKFHDPSKRSRRSLALPSTSS